LLPGPLPALARGCCTRPGRGVRDWCLCLTCGQRRTTPTLGSTGRCKRAGSDSENPLSISRWRRPSLRRK